MSRSSLPTFEKKKLMGILAVLTFGLTSLFAVLGGGTLVPATFILGFFVLLPLIALLGEDFPLVEPPEEAIPDVNPVETLRDSYARGEIDEEEFERRLEFLLDTEDLSEATVTEQTEWTMESETN